MGEEGQEGGERIIYEKEHVLSSPPAAGGRAMAMRLGAGSQADTQRALLRSLELLNSDAPESEEALLAMLRKAKKEEVAVRPANAGGQGTSGTTRAVPQARKPNAATHYSLPPSPSAFPVPSSYTLPLLPPAASLPTALTSSPQSPRVFASAIPSVPSTVPCGLGIPPLIHHLLPASLLFLS